jgi:hypothetical protein
MTMTNIDLKSFCGEDPFRPYLSEPVSKGDFTYAVKNGHVIIRVRRRPEAVELSALAPTYPIDPDKPFAGLDASTFEPVPPYSMPPSDPFASVPCPACHEGHIHDCPECCCICNQCDGTGLLRGKQSTTFCGVPTDLSYVRMVLDLPEIQVAKPKTPESPILFRFAGGVGALMPLRWRYGTHIEIFDSNAAEAVV